MLKKRLLALLIFIICATWILCTAYVLKRASKLTALQIHRQKEEAINSKTTSQSLIDKFVLFKSNKDYRFGDVIKHEGYIWKQSTLNILFDHHYNGTLLKDYILNTPHLNQQRELSKQDREYLLIKLMQQRLHKYQLPKNKELVIHLRLGDVCVHHWFLQKNYTLLISEYIRDNPTIEKVTFVGAFHYGDFIERGLWLFSQTKHKKNKDKLKILFDDVLATFPDLQVDVKSSSDVDADFIFMCYAKHFIKEEHGGFGQLVDDLRHKIHDLDT